MLQPNDPDNYYGTRELVPHDMLDDMQKARIVITNYHAFKRRERLELSAGGRALLQGRTGPSLETLETEGQMLQRVMPELMGMKHILALNDEAHHCYREKPPEPDDEALSAACLDGGPIHLNVQFAEPLLPDPDTDEPIRDSPRRSRPFSGERTPETSRTIPVGARTVVVAGDDSGKRARQLAEAGGWPLLAEPTSGSRNGANVIRSYRLLLGTDLGERIERVVVFGHPTLSRPVSRLLAREDVEVISVRARGRWPARPFAVAGEHDDFRVDGSDEHGWIDEWRAADTDLSARIDGFVAAEQGLTPYEVAAAVHRAVPPGGLLHVGASNPIRDLDLMAGAYPVGERRYVIANRGLAGIDGTLSSAIGATIGRPDTTRAIAYVGDVTFLHDLTGLVIGPSEAQPDLTVVVANDNGGSIFTTLEQGAPLYAGSFEKAFGTPHGADLAALCTGLRVPHWRVTDGGGLAHALAGPNGGIEVVEAVIRRDNRRALDAAIRALVSPDRR